MWGAIVGLALSAHPKWAIVQSDNRFDNAMVKQSAYSYAQFAANLNASYFFYTCNAKLAKPKLVENLCHRYSLILWADSDSIANFQRAREFGRHVNSHIKRDSTLHLLFGVDYFETLQRVKKGQSRYTHMFNAGIFVAVCPKATMVLNEWAYYAKFGHGNSDQIAVQTMALPNSVWSPYIRYEFKIFGAHSIFFRHYPGIYKKHFPRGTNLTIQPYRRRRCNWPDAI